MNAINLAMKQRHWVMACFALVILCIHIGEIRRTIHFVEKDQTHRSDLIQTLVQSNVVRTLNILGTSLNSEATNANRPNVGGVYYQPTRPFSNSDIQGIAERFNISTSSPQFLAMKNGKTTLWGFNFNHPKPHINLIAGLVSQRTSLYHEANVDLQHYFPEINGTANTLLFIRDNQHQYFMPSGEKINLDLSNTHALQPPEDTAVYVNKVELLDVIFFQLNNDNSRYFHLVEVPLPQLRATLFIFDNMTSSVAEIKGVIQSFVEVIALLGIGYVLLIAFSHYQYRTSIALESDALTGLKNRSYLESANSRIRDAGTSKNNRCIGVIAIDLDHFKLINDNYGHHTGDNVLVRISEILLENVRNNDECYRIGGDEFIVILKTESQSDIIKLADRIRDKIAYDPQLRSMIKGGVSASLGLVDLSTGQSIEEAIISADEMLYQAKNQGRNLVQSSLI
ncbi:diguanylate cyclase [Vibrio cyclitrophicus]|uniref:diguanylate cyclase n=1 Tax=Vibrio cyclitrophicus TaxID=47951 RepID=UPI000C863351|nr:diguanylate cyclase [Vibrio cyclitrophicus]PME21103.1 diguanylate cyclase [Vibrio cyclitrophicus]PMH48644.1 diguanylate cyclase [Vibrio cyclitrophicus]PMI69299.1 diguanylate cyclase [Vibrio cyclitrophicus]PMO08151.1 diguanylate cyclase [Vibrio cyclitrophicus]